MLDTLKKPLILILFVFVCLFVFVKFAGPIPFFINSIQTTKQNVFQVDGTGTASAVPDTAVISFGVTKSATSISLAQGQTNSVMNTILSNLQNEGIDNKNIQTTNYSVNPNYAPDGSTIQNYTVTQNVTVKVTNLDKVNQTIDLLTSKGANLVGQVSFTFSDNLEQKLENQARQTAVNNAKQKAESLANAAGIHLGNIIDVSEVNNQTAQLPIMNTLKVAAPSDVAQTNVTPGENEISLTVTLSYETY